MAPKTAKGEAKHSSESMIAPSDTNDTKDSEDFKAKVAALEHNLANLRQPSDGTGRVRAAESQNSRTALVLAITHKDISCIESGYSDTWAVTPLTIVRIEDAGFSKAPFHKGMSKQKMQEARPLAAIEGNELRMWSFKKAKYVFQLSLFPCPQVF
jgi:hypothetical protein